MGIVLKASVALTLAIVAVGALPARSQDAQPISEQTIFRESERLTRPAPLTPDVLKLLLATKQAKRVLDSMSDSQRENPARLFQASEIHLNSPDEIDLIVIGNSPMMNADSAMFWVVRSPRKHAAVILACGQDNLEVMRSKTNSYKDIMAYWSSPQETIITTYHYDGNAYRVWRNKTSHRSD
jgi:hypothetical protein